MTERTVAVVGAGNMGSGIAQALAAGGVSVLLADTTADKATAGRARIEAVLREGVERRLFSEAEAQATLGHVRLAAVGELGAAELVIEAVFEDLEVKRALFQELGRVCKRDCLLATNTSSFLVADLAEVTPHPERVIGLHYFYHPAKNRLVEVIGHAGTSAEALARAWELQVALRKLPIASKDAPGFVVNRFFVPWLNEAVRLHDEGLGIATIEAAAQGAFGVGMGPFALMNATGVPITLHAATSLQRRLGSFYAPAARLAEQVASGKPWDTGGDADDTRADEVSERLWGVVWHVAGTLVQEGVGSLEDTDLGARAGLKWPRGPFEQANHVGVAAARATAQRLARRYDLPESTTWTGRSAPFSLRRVVLTVEDGVASLRLNRPDQLNALDPETVAQLDACFGEALARPDVRGIVISGSGKAFVAGADVKFFVDRQAAGDTEGIVAFGRRGQELFRRIEQSPKRVVCAIDGLALGGGAELALACHAIVATPRARLGFPETGLGIYPGLGGTQRLTLRLGKGLARYFLYSGNLLGADELERSRLAWRVVPPEDLSRVARAALTEAPVQERLSAGAAPEPWARAARFLELDNAAGLCDGSLTLPGGPELAELAKKVRRKAPLAVQAVERLTALCEAKGLEAGLQAELESMAAIFASKDAREGMLAVVEKRHPKFVGA